MIYSVLARKPTWYLAHSLNKMSSKSDKLLADRLYHHFLFFLDFLGGNSKGCRITWKTNIFYTNKTAPSPKQMASKSDKLLSGCLYHHFLIFLEFFGGNSEEYENKLIFLLIRKSNMISTPSDFSHSSLWPPHKNLKRRWISRLLNKRNTGS